jgi:hypothetical protein
MERKPTRPQVFQLDEASRFLAPNGPALIGPDGTRHDIPPKVFEILRFVESVLAHNQAVKVTPLRPELPIDEAADAVDMPRDELRAYVAEGRIPFRSSQYLDWVKLADVVEFKARLKAESRVALDELLSEDLWDEQTGDGPTPRPEN